MRTIRVTIKPTEPFETIPELCVKRKSIISYDSIKSNPTDPLYPRRMEYLFDSLFKNFDNEEIVSRFKTFKFAADVTETPTIFRYQLPEISAIADITVYLENKIRETDAINDDDDSCSKLRLNWLRYSPDIDNAEVTSFCPKAQPSLPLKVTGYFRDKYFVAKFPFCRSTISDNYQRYMFGGKRIFEGTHKKMYNLVRDDTFGLFGVAKYNNGIEIELSSSQPQRYTLFIEINYFDVICRYINAMFYKYHY